MLTPAATPATRSGARRGPGRDRAWSAATRTEPLSLDGVSGEIDTGYVQSGGQRLHVEAWFEPATAAPTKAIVAGPGAGRRPEPEPGCSRSGKAVFELDSNSLEIGNRGHGGHQRRPAAPTWSGTWAGGGAVTPGQFTLYVDGTAVATTTVLERQREARR